MLKDLKEVATPPLSANRMSVNSDGKANGWIEWCAETGIIMADSGGEYSIGSDRHDKFFPNFKPGKRTSKFSAIKYARPDMPHPQIRLMDYENYYEILVNPANGEMTRNSKIGACGPLKMMTRKVEQFPGGLAAYINSDGANWKLVASKSYDNEGRMLREVDSLGNIKEWIYDDKGRLVRLQNGNELLKEYKFHPNGKLGTTRNS